MAVYTCFDMIRDCREGKAAGWNYFAKNFIAPLRMLLRHYAGTADHEQLLSRLLQELRSTADRLFARLSPMPERQFFMLLRPRVLAVTKRGEPESDPLDLETLTAALQDYSPVERQITWLETMEYGVPETAALMRVSVETVERLRRRTGELLRARLDRWSENLLRDSGRALGEEAAARAPEKPLQFRDLTDLIDGRITWQARLEVEHRLFESWHEVDHLCRLREADAAITASKPLEDAEVSRYRALLGGAPERIGFWRRLTRAR